MLLKNLDLGGMRNFGKRFVVFLLSTHLHGGVNIGLSGAREEGGGKEGGEVQGGGWGAWVQFEKYVGYLLKP